MTPAALRQTLAWLVMGAIILVPVPSVVASFEGQMPDRMVSHVFGVICLMCMVMSLVISARPWGIDAAFAGLDKAYVVHKWLGLLVFGTLLIHDSLESEVDGLKSPVTLWGIDWHDLGSSMGVWVYNGLLVLLVATFLKRLPYRWWYWTHRAMILVYLLSVAHFIVIPKPLSLAEFGGVYVLGWSALGLIAGLFSLVPVAKRGGIEYKAIHVAQNGRHIVLRLAPVSTKTLVHRAGQFVMLRGTAQELQEWHPFTISSAPQEDGEIELTIARRDRWTETLFNSASEGDPFRVKGPHGRFFPASGDRRQVWLSGGVGVTPHLAWARANVAVAGKVDIIHICRSRTEVPQLEALEHFAAAHDGVTLKVYETKDRGRPSPHDLLRLMGDRNEPVDVFFCGPKGLRDGLSVAGGLAKRATLVVHEEKFELRSDLPLPGWFKGILQTLKDANQDGLFRQKRS